MLQLAGAKPIKRRFEVTFPSVAMETTANYDQAIPQVQLDRSIIRFLCDRDSVGSAWSAPAAFANFGLKFQNDTTARLVAQNTYLNSGGGSANMKAQVTEFAFKPKSLQYVLCNGTTSLPIAEVDPTRADLILAFLAAYDYSTYFASLGATAITLNAALNAPCAFWVVEF